MISFVLAALLLLGSYGGTPKKALIDCLNNATRENLKAKVTPEAFDAALSSACAAEAAAFRQAIINQRLAAKMKRADAEEIAAGDAEDIFLNAKEMYREYAESNTQPPG